MRRATGSRAIWWSVARSLSTDCRRSKEMMRNWLYALAAATLGACASPAAWAQISGDTVKLGVLTDMSGVYSDNSGAGMVLATRMAIEDFGGKVNGKPIEVVTADHQNKAD